MDLTRDKLTAAFRKTIVRETALDPAVASILADRLVTRLEDIMDDSEGGYGVTPIRITEGERPARAAERPTAPRPRLEAVDPEKEVGAPPPVPASRMIALPGDPEFTEAEKQYEKEKDLGKPAVQALRVTKATSASASEDSVQYWTPETMIKELEKRFPAKVRFTPDGMPDEVKITAIRNIRAQINQYGAHGVRIEYAPESEGHGGIDYSTIVGEGVPSISLGRIASHLFSCADANIDADGTLRSLADQLCGLFKPRPAHMEPGYIGEPPIDSWNANTPGMKDNDTIRMVKGYQQVSDPQSQVHQSVVEINRQYGTPGAVPRK